MVVQVHSSSKLSASALVKAIQADKKIPGNYKTSFSAKGGKILVAFNQVKLPPHTQIKNWYRYVDRAANVQKEAKKHNVWYITTGKVVGSKSGGFLPSKSRFKAVTEPTSVSADLPLRQLILLKPLPSAAAPAKKSQPQTAKAKPGATKIDMTKSGRKPKSGQKLPTIIKKGSLGAIKIIIPSQMAMTDALGICLVHHTWPDSMQSPVGHIGKGGLLVVANRVDSSTFRDKKNAATLGALVTKELGSTIIHEMIHAGIYAHGTKLWLGHPAKIFGPFL
jgi:hypothetical protein